jgi:peptidoglycan glycosyltransferase
MRLPWTRRRGRPASPAPALVEGPNLGGAIVRLGVVIVLGYLALVAGLGWWQVVEAGRLTDDPLNPLRLAAVRAEPRGRILDGRGRVLALSEGDPVTGQVRRYPFPEVAPVVGYQSLVLGTAGLERTYDRQLIGLDQLGPGDGLLRKFRPDPVDPSDLVLSLDLRLQRLAVELLGDDAGAVVALEPATGRVLALATGPAYDPGRLSAPETGRAYLDELRADPRSPLLVRATQAAYVPGSVFKLVTAAAALESGAIDPGTRYPAQPRQSREGFVVDGYRIRDAPRTVQLDEPLDLAEATEVSSNVWFAHAALDAGGEALEAMARRLGFGGALPFELPAVASQVNDGAGRLAGFTDRPELATAGFGQGRVLATPLQMALVAATVANGGEVVAPRLVDRLVSANGEVRRLESRHLGRAMSSATADALRAAMVRAVEGPYAGGLAGGAGVPGITTAGKSGTAELAEGEAPHSWFVGFAPAEAPRIAIAVVVEHGGFGSERAVPMARRLLESYLRRSGER